jgi:hypothetical protein
MKHMVLLRLKDPRRHQYHAQGDSETPATLCKPYTCSDDIHTELTENSCWKLISYWEMRIAAIVAD